MSFGDIKAGGARSSAPAIQRRQSGGNSVQSELQDFQRVFMKLKHEMSKIRGNSISTSVKVELDKDMKGLKDMETRIKNQLDSQMKQLENMPRSEIAQRRVGLTKLSKDFERIRLETSQLSTDVTRLRVNDKLAAPETNTIGNNASSGHGGMSGSTVFRMDDETKNGRSPERESRGGTAGGRQNQEVQFKKVVQGQDVDDLIAEERQREILKMNQDLKMVNEMFKDMAEIVQEQGEIIQTVAETTENSNSRAKAGLTQVEQAAGYQSGCVMV